MQQIFFHGEGTSTANIVYVLYSLNNLTAFVLAASYFVVSSLLVVVVFRLLRHAGCLIASVVVA
jgi:hypothetical protein